jgi:DNA-binding NarL/FixJ family response regulator
MLDLVSGRLLSPVFVGRGPELEMLREQLADAAAGRPGVVVLGGDAGVGKTRLVDEFVRDARDDAQVVVGGCLDLGDNGLAFTPFVAALRDLVRLRGTAAVTELLGPGRTELAALVPELALADDEDPAATGPSSDLLRLYEGVADLLERASELQPLVVVLEDLHWADRSSRDLLAFLARTLRHSRVLVVATYRADDLHRTHPLRPFLAELDRVRGVTRVTLSRLARDEVAAQMAPLLGRDPTASELDRVYERSEGNPLFVEELTCCFPESGLPDSLRDLLMIRTERLDQPARQVLQVAAVIGSRVHYPLVAAVSEQQEAELMDSLRAAVEANVLVADTEAEAFTFRHSLLRDAIHDDLLPGEHARLHARLAQVLTESPDLVRADRQPAEVAHHWHAAHDQPRALAAAYVAAEQAQHVHAYAEQLQLLERMLGLWSVVPDPEAVAGVDLTTVLRLAVGAASRAGQLDRVRPLADQLVAAAEATGDKLRLADALLQRGKWCAVDPESADADLRRALDLLPADQPSKLRARALDMLAMRQLLRGKGDVGEQLARESLSVAQESGSTTVEISAMSTLSTVLVSTDDVEQGLDFARQALALASDDDNELMLIRVLTNMSHALCGLGRHEEAVDAARRGLAVTEKLGLTRTFGQLLSGNLADPLVLLGRLDEAAAVVDDALALGWATASGTAYLVQLAGRIALLRGDLAAAESLVAQGDQVKSRERLLLQDWLPLVQLGAALATEQDDPDAGYARAMTALAGPLPTDHTRYLWPLLVEAARAVADRAARARDLHDDARLAAVLADAERVRHDSDQLPVPGAAGTAWRTHLHAELDRAQGVDDRQTWEQVVNGYTKVDEVLQVAAARIRMAELAVADGDRPSAAALLQQATETAASSGAGLLLERAHRLARRARIVLAEDGADDELAGDDADDPVARLGLTEREHEVLLLVADGLSNRQIGERLYMSPKTASVHVSAILAKLQVSGRGEAAAVAHRMGLVR